LQLFAPSIVVAWHHRGTNGWRTVQVGDQREPAWRNGERVIQLLGGEMRLEFSIANAG